MKKNYTTSNPYKIGDIVTTCWGYSMAIVQFYEVTRVTACKVGLRELKQTEIYDGFLSGTTTPRLGEYIPYDGSPYSVQDGQLFKVRVNGDILIPDYPGRGYFAYARKWSGNPRRFNHCD